MNDTELLWTICEETYFPRKLAIRHPHTKKQYKLAVGNLAEYLGRRPELRDLTDDNIVGMMQHLLNSGMAPRTVNERRGRINCLWSWLAKKGYTRLHPTTEKCPEQLDLPFSWSESQLRLLFRSAAAEQDPVGAIHGGAWWVALYAWIWNTSERIGATLALEWAHLDLDGGTALVPAKLRKGSHKWASYTLWPETVILLRAIHDPRQKLVFYWPFHMDTYYKRYDRILKRAGLPHGRKHKSHALRVSHATWVRALSGSSAQTLGHSDSATTVRHYEDPRIARKEAPNLFIPWQETG